MGRDILRKAKAIHERIGQPSARKPSSRSQRIIVVAYDGKKTEAEYFSGWRRYVGYSGVALKPLYIKSGGNVLNLVRLAKRRAKEDRTYDEFWCVCDIDDTSPEDVRLAILSAQAEPKIRLAMSARSFEVWLALHWGRISLACVNCEDEAVQLIKQHYSGYSKKNKFVPFSIVRDLAISACENAQWLRERGCKNPLTDVDLLVCQFLGESVSHLKNRRGELNSSFE